MGEMSIDWEDVDTLRRELDASRKEARAHAEPLMRMVEAYHANNYATNMVSGADQPENIGLIYVSSVSADLVHHAPSYMLRTDRSEPEMQLDSIACEHFLNRWAKESRLERQLKPAVVEFLMSYTGVLVQRTANDHLHSADRMPKDVREQLQGPYKKRNYNPGGHEFGAGVSADVSPLDEMRPMIPKVTKLDPMCWGWDPAAKLFEDARYVWHQVMRDKDQVLAHAMKHPEEGWYTENLRALQPANSSSADVMYGKIPQRNDVCIVEMWVPEYQCDDSKKPEDGYHGSIVTLGVVVKADYSSVDTKLLRKPRPFYGHPRGPFVLGGVYAVPGSAWPMGPIGANMAQIEDLNDVERGNTESSKRYKRLMGYPAQNTKAAEQLRKQGHDDFVPLAGMEPNKLYPIEVGGVTQQMLVQADQLRQRLERNLGLSEVQAGRAVQDKTATADALAAQATQKRLVSVIQSWDQFNADIAERVVWYPFHDSDVVWPLSREVAESFGHDGPMWVQGGQEKDAAYAFEDLELSIQPGSMQNKDKSQERAEYVELMTLTANMAPLMAQMPAANWLKLLDDLGKQYGQEDWGQRWAADQLGGQPVNPEETDKAQFQVDTPGQGASGLPDINISGGGGGQRQPSLTTPQAQTAQPGGQAIGAL